MSVRSIMKSPNVLLVSGIAFNSAPNDIQTQAYGGGGGGGSIFTTLVQCDAGLSVPIGEPTTFNGVVSCAGTGTITNCGGVAITAGDLVMTATSGRFSYQSANNMVLSQAGIELQAGNLAVTNGTAQIGGVVTCASAAPYALVVSQGGISTHATSNLAGLTVTAPLINNSTSNLNGLVTCGAGATITTGGLVVTAGGASITAGNLGVANGNLTIAGSSTLMGAVTCNNTFEATGIARLPLLSAGTITFADATTMNTAPPNAAGNLTTGIGGTLTVLGTSTLTGEVTCTAGVLFGVNPTPQTVPFITTQRATQAGVQMGTSDSGTANPVPVSITTMISNGICYFTVIFPINDFIAIGATAGGFFFATGVGALPTPYGGADYNGLTILESNLNPNVAIPWYFSIVNNGQFYIWFPDTTPANFYGQAISGSYMIA